MNMVQGGAKPRIMSKSVLRRLRVQIPEKDQPAFLALLFSAEVLKKAAEIAEQVQRRQDK